MKTLNNLFGKKLVNERISLFSNYSLSGTQMMAIKGGTEPIVYPIKPGGENPPPKDL